MQHRRVILPSLPSWCGGRAVGAGCRQSPPSDCQGTAPQLHTIDRLLLRDLLRSEGALEAFRTARSLPLESRQCRSSHVGDAIHAHSMRSSGVRSSCTAASGAGSPAARPPAALVDAGTLAVALPLLPCLPARGARAAGAVKGCDSAVHAGGGAGSPPPPWQQRTPAAAEPCPWPERLRRRRP